VKDPIVGMHDWVASFDLNSLYPHLIMMYNLSPETLIDYSEYDNDIHQFMKQGINIDSLLKGKIDTSVLKEKNITVTPNGQLFSTQRQGFLSELMETMYEDRAMYKRKAIEGKKLLQTETDPVKRKELENQISKFNNIQLAKKVTLNSAYGAIGNNYFRFFDIRIAEAITLSGQLAIKWIEEKLNQHLNKALKTNADYVIASDTDSIYLNLGPMIRKIVPNEPKEKIINMMDKFCDQNLQPYIDKSYQELADYVNAYAQKMIMKREALADKAIWTAKKRYLINVYDNEGVRYKEPQLKIMGLEAIKSSTPMVCREKIKEAFKIMISGTESDMIAFIEKFRKDFKSLPPEDVAFPRSINDLGKYRDKLEIYKKGTPIHVKGSLLYNSQLVAHNLQKKYEQINDGDKIKFTYMKEPNPFQCTVISFPNILPKEFDLEKYIDYNTQFDKTFLDPLKIVMDAINWSVEKQSTLEFLFG
jgi:DNA polymerase elongation subunit (family B)